jgi:hypothetical protein
VLYLLDCHIIFVTLFLLENPASMQQRGELFADIAWLFLKITNESLVAVDVL